MNCCHIGWRRRFVIKFETPSAVHPSLLHVSLVTYCISSLIPNSDSKQPFAAAAAVMAASLFLLSDAITTLLEACVSQGVKLRVGQNLKGIWWYLTLFLSLGQPLQIRYHLTWPSCVSVCIVSRRIWLRSVPFQPCWVLLCVIIQPSIHPFFLAGPKQ